MVTQDDQGNISISYGDTFAVKFKLNKPLSVDDSAVLSLYDGERVVLEQKINGNDTNELKFVVSAEDMSQLEQGVYAYDMHIDFADGRVFTTNWKRKIRLKGVAHDVLNH